MKFYRDGFSIGKFSMRWRWGVVKRPTHVTLFSIERYPVWRFSFQLMWAFIWFEAWMA